MDIETTELETKAGIPADAVVTHADMMRAFEEFKETNDARLSATERRKADALWEEKLARIDRTIEAHARRLEAIALKRARPTFGSYVSSPERKAAFESYMRSGDSVNLRALESKALSAGSNPDGGFLVPPEIETQIGQRLIAISPIRSIAGMRTITAMSTESRS